MENNYSADEYKEARKTIQAGEVDSVNSLVSKVRLTGGQKTTLQTILEIDGKIGSATLTQTEIGIDYKPTGWKKGGALLHIHETGATY